MAEARTEAGLTAVPMEVEADNRMAAVFTAADPITPVVAGSTLTRVGREVAGTFSGAAVAVEDWAGVGRPGIRRWHGRVADVGTVAMHGMAAPMEAGRHALQAVIRPGLTTAEAMGGRVVDTTVAHTAGPATAEIAAVADTGIPTVAPATVATPAMFTGAEHMAVRTKAERTGTLTGIPDTDASVIERCRIAAVPG